jgi:N6-adenosine-specific RNA methylase IME4
MIHESFLDIPRGHYSVLLADPPWHFKAWSPKGKNRSPDYVDPTHGCAERHYATMTLAQIKALPVGALAAKQSALFLWAVDCMLPEAIAIGTGWGFKFKTVAFTWAKMKKPAGLRPIHEEFHTGLGYWTRGNPESCLLFTRGAPKRQSASVRQLILSQRREHSRKPDEQYERIEQLLPGSRLELFSRTPREGWDSWGLQAKKFAECEV